MHDVQHAAILIRLCGCYAFGITLEKVDLDLRGAHHDIRLSRALRLDSLRINSFGIELSR